MKTLLLLSLFGFYGCGKEQAPTPLTELGHKLIKNITAVNLDRSTFDQVAFESNFQRTVDKWTEGYPEANWQDAVDYFEQSPVVMVFVPNEITCPHSGNGTDYQLCLGLLPEQKTNSTYMFVTMLSYYTFCTSAMSHELSHLFSFILLHDADPNHANPKVWTDIVQALHDDC